jgi:hypothetical protein
MKNVQVRFGAKIAVFLALIAAVTYASANLAPASVGEASARYASAE